MKLCHEDARDVVIAAKKILLSFQRLVDAGIDAAMSAADVETLRKDVVMALRDMTNFPPIDAMSRIESEYDFYERNYARLTRQNSAAAAHQERKREGKAKTRLNYFKTGKHARADKRDNADFHLQQKVEEIPAWALAPDIATMRKMKESEPLASYQAMYESVDLSPKGNEAPKVPLFKVQESEKAKESDATDELSF